MITDSSVRVVLVEPSHPGNIGATARAMKAMCLRRLYLVKPKSFPHAEATARASGADDVLSEAICCDSLQDALRGCTLAFACSARQRSLSWPQLSPRQYAKLMVSEYRSVESALVFGREQSGLSNEELDLCQYLVYIPSNPVYNSLNLAAAVQVLSYELFVASERENRFSGPAKLVPEADPVAQLESVERMYDHLEETLIALEFLDPANPKYLMRRLRRLFNRARLTRKEVNILRGMLTATLRKISHR